MFKEIENYITIKEIDSKVYKVSFIDMEDLTKENDNLVVKAITKENELKETQKTQIKDFFFKNIYDLCETIEDDVLEKFTYRFNDNQLKTNIKSIIKNATLHIASNGRIGPASHIIISKENYDKFNLSENDIKLEVLYVDNDVKDIYLYRKNTIEQPGLIMLYYNENDEVYFNIESIGLYPERQFIKITIK